MHRSFKCLLYQYFALVVEMARCFVEDHYGWVFEQQASNGKALLFSTRQAIAALANNGFISVGQRINNVVNLCLLARVDHFVARCIWSCVQQV